MKGIAAALCLCAMTASIYGCFTDMGSEGEPCSTKGVCFPGLVCNEKNMCVKPGAAADGGGADSSLPSDGSVDAGTDTDSAPDSGQDAGEDAALDSGSDSSYPPDASDAGVADTGTDAGCNPDCVGRCGGSDNCDGTCPDNCVAPQMCGGGGTPYVCGTVTVTCGPSPSSKGGDMCDVPAGPFWMGCNVAVDTECQSNEYPYHEVTVPAFKIDKFEITVSEYKACVSDSGCTAAGNTAGWGCNYEELGRENHPINCMDWPQAKEYCAWAGKRLPTETQWEKAARGTDGRKYPWGNDLLDCDHAVHSANGCSNSNTAPVGSKPAGVSPYGAMDMVGNVYEWVEDDFHDTYTGAPANGSAWVDSPRATSRSVRGGDWGHNYTYDLRASFRGGAGTTWSFPGFRCAVDQ